MITITGLSFVFFFIAVVTSDADRASNPIISGAHQNFTNTPPGNAYGKVSCTEFQIGTVIPRRDNVINGAVSETSLLLLRHQ